MGKSRLPYPEEFKKQIIQLHRAGRSIKELAEEFEPTEPTIRDPIKKADADEGRRTDVPTCEEREELRRLRKENRRLKTEREIPPEKQRPGSLKETEHVPPKS